MQTNFDRRVTARAGFVFDGRFLVAVTLLMLVWWELHELVHIISGYAYCGAFGSRDFNSWALVEGCDTVVPTFLGPVFTIASGWVAIALMFSRRGSIRAFGVALFWAANPASRLLSVLLFGGGDEAYALNRVLGLDAVDNGFTLAERLSSVILALAIIPQLIVFAYKMRPRWWLWLPVFTVLPLATALAVLIGIYTPLHASGWLSAPAPLGSSQLILGVSVFNLIGCALTVRWLFRTRGSR